jgi:Na+-driven multidrug efflux pump
MTAGLCLSLSVTVPVAVALLAARHVAGRLFTDDDDVVASVAEICPLLALCICLDGTQTILSGR